MVGRLMWLSSFFLISLCGTYGVLFVFRLHVNNVFTKQLGGCLDMGNAEMFSLQLKNRSIYAGITIDMYRIEKIASILGLILALLHMSTI